MTFNISIPDLSGIPKQIVLSRGECLFIVGANGAGKSSLMHLIYQQFSTQSQRISAHRQTWFASNAVTLSPDQKRQTESQIKGNDFAPNSRWKDDYSAQRASIAIYDLIDAENVRARSIAQAFDDNDIESAKSFAAKDAPLKKINELLRLSNLPIVISVQKNEQVLASRRGSVPYSVAELSDGERNALLIAANVLTVPPGTLILVDEPERHLHRSIISPLLTLLFAMRADCVFVVSTHDVMLPIDNSNSKTLLVRDCVYQLNSIHGWDSDLLVDSEGINESLKQDILGSRRQVLFVEGTVESLDAPLYALLFPNVSVIAKHSCRDVISAVSGIRGSADLHWIRAFGLIDNDRRMSAEIEKLMGSGIYALDFFLVESIYYHPNIQRLLAIRCTELSGSDSASMLSIADEKALLALAANQQRLCERVAEKAIRNSVERQLPTRADVSNGKSFSINIDVSEFIKIEMELFSKALEARDLHTLISRYPIRETPALKEIATSLHFQNCNQYEAAVRQMFMNDANAMEFVRSLFGSLNAELQRP